MDDGNKPWTLVKALTMHPSVPFVTSQWSKNDLRIWLTLNEKLIQANRDGQRFFHVQRVQEMVLGHTIVTKYQ